MSDELYLLVVDDDADVRGTLQRTLTRNGYHVKAASSGQEALDKLLDGLPDLIILDVMMPGQSGIDVCKRIRSNRDYNNIPILFLTARGQSEDIVAGLDAGGDDYVTKPFEGNELMARVRALLRRIERDDTHLSAEIKVGDLELDSNTYRVSYKDTVVQLTATEHRLLRYLMEHAGQALSPTHLLESVWGYPPETGDPDLVRAHIRNLRSKLEELGSNEDFIKTLHGVGYMIGD